MSGQCTYYVCKCVCGGGGGGESVCMCVCVHVHTNTHTLIPTYLPKQHRRAYSPGGGGGGDGSTSYHVYLDVCVEDRKIHPF